MLLALVGCKTAGTIELDLPIDCGSGSGSSFDVVYAEPNTSCDVCACGGCAGRHEGVIVACYHCSDDQLPHLPVDLTAGSWAVIVEKWDDVMPYQMRASSCVEVIVVVALASSGYRSGFMPSACQNSR